MRFYKFILRSLSTLYIISLTLLSFAMYWPREWWWLANAVEMMPGWIFAIPVFLFFVASAAIKDIRLFVFQWLALIILLFGVMGLQVRWTQTDGNNSESNRIRIMSVNMGTTGRLADLQKLIDNKQPDIIAFQEFKGEKLAAIQKTLPAGLTLHSEGSGLGIASRFPVLETDARDSQPPGGFGNFIRRFALQTPSGTVHLFNVHLETPREGIEALIEKKFGGTDEMKVVTKQQEAESLQASEWAAKYDNVIVVGDFNMRAQNPIHRHYWFNFTDAFSRAGKGLGYTKYTRWHGVRIDRVLTDKNWEAVNFTVGPDIGSDHRPIIADLIPLSLNVPQDSSSEESKSSPSFQEENALRPAAALPEKAVYKQGEFPAAAIRFSEKNQTPLLVSSGIPFAPGQLTDAQMFAILDEKKKEIPIAVRVLARWPQDQSIRSVLVQFRYPIEKKLRNLFFRWGYERTTKNLEIIEPEWDYPEAYLTLLPEWLCDSRVIGRQVPFGIPEFKSYDDKIDGSYHMMGGYPWKNNVGQDHYYDTPHVLYQFYVRSGALRHFLDARRELLHYRDAMIIQEGPDRGMAKGGAQTRYIYVQAMADDYLLTGDPRSLKVAGYMRDYLKKKFGPSKAFYSKKSNGFWTEREAAFPLLGVLAHYELTQDPDDKQWIESVFDNLYQTQLQWPDRGGFIHNLYAHDPEEGCLPDEYGGSPFMSGFLLEGIIKYHEMTGDPRAADSVFRAVDWMIKEGMTNSRDTFRYMTCEAYDSNGGEPDLNLAIVHAYGYAYRLSGYQDQQYLDLGQRILRRGIKDGWLGDRKHFNQQFRSSGHYPAYVYEGLRLPRERSRQGSAEMSPEETENARLSTVVIGNNYTSSFAPDLPGGVLNLERSKNIAFKYRISPGDALGIKVRTGFGDWICLGGTKSFVYDAIAVSPAVVLMDDGEWHDISLDVDAMIKSRLPGLKSLDAVKLQYSNSSGDGFDIDQWRVW